MIDRIAPTRRPPGNNDGTQRWESLLFCHWEVDVAVLRPLVPSPLRIDTFEGKTYIGIVPFKMRDIRPRWLPKSLAFQFLETNVRLYVVHEDRPGVYFCSLEANSLLAVLAARLGWSLPYFYAKMSAGNHDESYSYRSRRRFRRASHSVSFRIAKELGPSDVGSLEHFLLERYLLFTHRAGRLQVGQVHHQPYHAYAATITQLTDSLAEAAGLPDCSRQPDMAHYCPGVDVEVFGIRRS